MDRAAGILLSIFSLPGRYGMGTISDALPALELMAEAGQSLWQILPAGPVGGSFSPYFSSSAFAGNPLLISPAFLRDKGLISAEEEREARLPALTRIDYPAVLKSRYPLLQKAFSRCAFDSASFRASNPWAEDYCLFSALKKLFKIPFQEWPEDIRCRSKEAVESYAVQLTEEIEFRLFMQSCFFEEWSVMKAKSAELGISIIGDVPIYVSPDSADVWTMPECFLLDESMSPRVVSGMPPDAFSPTGQLWGSPIYDYDRMAADGFSWWRSRIKKEFLLADMLRIDHFRGFSEFFAIPFGAEAGKGEWRKGPGEPLVEAILEEASGGLIAEDLGGDTEGVLHLLNKYGIPGMRVLEFAFDAREDNKNLPHLYPRSCAAYTGTHDNDTALGWYTSAPVRERSFARAYLGLNEREGIAAGLIRGVLSSRADIAIIPMQDWLGLPGSARMNVPSTVEGNWQWRMTEPFDPVPIRERTRLFNRLRP